MYLVMEELRSWYRDKFKTNKITDKQLDKVYEAAAITRSSFMRWLYADYTPSQVEFDILKEQAQALGYV